MASFFTAFRGILFRFDFSDVPPLGRRTTVTSFLSFEKVHKSLKNDLKTSFDNCDPPWCSALDKMWLVILVKVPLTKPSSMMSS